jgi:hypothetical protein
MSTKVPAQVVKLQTIQLTVDALKQLPKKQKEDFALREAIYQMHQQLEEVLKRGYSFDEVAEILSHNGIEIKAVTLKQYLTTFRREKSRKRSVSKRSKPIEAEVEIDSVPDQPEVSASREKAVKTEKSKAASERKIGKFVEIPDDL